MFTIFGWSQWQRWCVVVPAILYALAKQLNNCRPRCEVRYLLQICTKAKKKKNRNNIKIKIGLRVWLMCKCNSLHRWIHDTPMHVNSHKMKIITDVCSCKYSLICQMWIFIYLIFFCLSSFRTQRCVVVCRNSFFFPI